MSKYQLTDYGIDYLAKCLKSGEKPVIQKQGTRLNLNKIDELDAKTAALFLAPDGKNPYFEAAKAQPQTSSSPSTATSAMKPGKK